MGRAVYHGPSCPPQIGDRKLPRYTPTLSNPAWSTNALTEPLFDLAAEYEQLLDQGLSLSGENRRFFLRGRVADLRQQLRSDLVPRRILDFGCGTGDTSRYLAEEFSGADVLGVDNARNALAWAETHHGGPRVRFEHLDAFDADAAFDLCYVNGVFHHVAPERRGELAGRLSRALRTGGMLALFENNPWNPGARMVMRRIPFDRDAIPLSPPETRRLVEAAGLRVVGVRSLFYFPSALAFLRPLEPALAFLPLGAQYYVLGAKT